MTVYVARWGNPSKDITTEIEFDAMSDEHARHKAGQLAAQHGIRERLHSIRKPNETYAETASQRRFVGRARAQARRAQVPA